MAPAKKNQKMSIGAFLQDESLGSWADEMEDMPISTNESRTSYGGERRNFGTSGGAGNGYSDRRDGFPPREQLPLPTQPPYTAHIGNMSFDTTQDDVGGFFQDCEVTNVRIVEDKLDRKPKGFGYVEFGTLEGLKKALTYNGANLGGRNIRISVADPPKDRQDGRDFSDWSRKGPLPELPGQQRRVSDRPSFPGRSFDNMSDAGSERGNRRPFDQGDGKPRDFSNWERKGPLSPSTSAAPTLREGGRQMSKDGPGFRRSSPAWGEGRSQEGSRPPKREYQDKPAIERAPTASELDNQWRSKMRPDAVAKSPTPSREASNPPSPAPAPAQTLATRPKLNLQKRTVSEADPAAVAAVAAASTASTADSKASPFGAARPVDTSAKEKEIEEKRQLALRQKKEAEDKARAEKAEKAEERRAAKESKGKTVTDKGSTDEAESVDAEQNGGETSPPAKSIEILQRANETGTDDATAEDDGDREAEDGPVSPVAPVAQDTAVKPREIVRPIGQGKANGAWRGKGTKQKETTVQETAPALEEDGWSTVSNTKQRNNRRGNQGARAIAS